MDWIQKTDTEYRYELKDGVLFIEFRGSTSREDWRQNFRLWAKPYKDMPVKWYAHRGFIAKYKEVRDDILELAQGAEVVQLSGHSQGGAVALLAIEDIRFNYPEKLVKCITTGSPRVVWCWNYRKIKNRFNGLIRKVGSRDIVPHLPPWIFGYRHVGKKKVIKNHYKIWKFEKNHMKYYEG